MKIDMHNYEAFFLDFVEGKLDDASTLEMLAFLRKHPGLKAELETYTDIRLEPADIYYSGKNQLKKFDFSHPVNQNNFGDYCIAFHEKLLSPSETEHLYSYLDQNPDKKNEFQLFGKVYLKADPSIVFAAKPFLKKRPKGVVRSVILKMTAVAAGIALIVSIFYKSFDKDVVYSPDNSNVAVKEKVEVKKPDLLKNIPEPVLTVSKPAKPEVLAVKSDVPMEREENLEPLAPVEVMALKGEEYLRPDIFATLNSSDRKISDDGTENVLKEKVLKNRVEPITERRISLWDIADITLKGYNRLAEKDIILHRKTDENGKLTAIAIETENRKYGFETRNYFLTPN